MRKREDGDVVVTLVAEGHSDAEIAAMLGRSASAVQRQRNRLGVCCAVVRKQWSPARVKQVVSLLMAGEKLPEIDARLGLKAGASYKRLQRLGVSTRGVDGPLIASRLVDADSRERLGLDASDSQRAKTWTREEASALGALVSQGVGDREIGRRLGRPLGAVGQQRRTLGLLRGARGRTWAVADDVRLRAMRAEGMVFSEIGEALPLISRQYPTDWSAEDDATLRLEWERGATKKAIAERLGRTPEAVHTRRWTLGLAARAFGRWRVREDGDQVAALVAEGRNDAEIAVQLGRSTAAVQKQRQRLGLGCVAIRTRWSPERVAEVARLLEGGLKLHAIDALLGLKPGATYKRLERLGVSTLGVDGREIARRLAEADRVDLMGSPELVSRRHKRWPSHELARLQALASQGVSDFEIGRLVGRSAGAVAQQRRRLGLSMKTRGDRWTAGEDARLAALRGQRKTLREIGEILGRTVAAVRSRVTRLGLYAPSWWWSADDDETLRLEWRRGTKAKKIAVELGRTEHAVWSRRGRLRLTSRPGGRKVAAGATARPGSSV